MVTCAHCASVHHHTRPHLDTRFTQCSAANDHQTSKSDQATRHTFKAPHILSSGQKDLTPMGMVTCLRNASVHQHTRPCLDIRFTQCWAANDPQTSKSDQATRHTFKAPHIITSGQKDLTPMGCMVTCLRNASVHQHTRPCLDIRLMHCSAATDHQTSKSDQAIRHIFPAPHIPTSSQKDLTPIGMVTCLRNASVHHHTRPHLGIKFTHCSAATDHQTSMSDRLDCLAPLQSYNMATY
jgi:hypothetical protein